MTYNEKLNKYKHYIKVLEEEMDVIMEEHISFLPFENKFIKWSDKMVDLINVRDYYAKKINELEQVK